MKIEYRVGNLLDFPGKFILQGCNALGYMNSGVAKAIRDKYPQAYEQYITRHTESPLRVGEVISVDCGQHVILNGISQQYCQTSDERYGPPDKQYVDYAAIESIIRICDNIAKYHTLLDATDYQPEHGNRLAIALPLIGAGLANGDWAIISRIIEDLSTHFTPIVYVLDASLIPK